jgi:Putative DNA-binding domain
VNRPAPSLAELQGWLRWLLTHPRGVGRALGPGGAEGLGERYLEPGARWLDAVGGPASASRERRLAVYAEGYFTRAHEALATDYPAVRAVVGEQRFRELVAGVLLAGPFTSFTLADAGETLPELLSVLLREGEPAWVTELARLERAVVEVTLCDVPGPLDPASLPSGPEAWEGARVVVSPALRLLQLTHAVETLWRPAAEGRPLPEAPAADARSLVVVRDRNGLWVESLERAAWEVLSDLRNGRCLGTTCARLGEGEGTAERVGAWFGVWMERGWLADVVFRNALRAR